MRRRIALVLLILLAACSGAVGGFVCGERRSFDWAAQQRQQEVAGRLVVDLLVLSRLRMGDEAGAIRTLEDRTDSAVTSLPSGKKPSELDKWVVSNLGVAKLYRAVYPPPESSRGAVMAVLTAIPTPTVKYCDRPLQVLAERARPLLAKARRPT